MSFNACITDTLSGHDLSIIVDGIPFASFSHRDPLEDMEDMDKPLNGAVRQEFADKREKGLKRARIVNGVR